MRITITIDDALLGDVEAAAAREGRTLTAIIEAALREHMARTQHHPRGESRLPVSGKDGLHPGIDLDDSSGLLAAFDDHG